MDIRQQKQILARLQALELARAWDSLEEYEKFLAEHLTVHTHTAIFQAFEVWQDRRVARAIEDLNLILGE